MAAITTFSKKDLLQQTIQNDINSIGYDITGENGYEKEWAFDNITDNTEVDFCIAEAGDSYMFIAYNASAIRYIRKHYFTKKLKKQDCVFTLQGVR